ncbi:MAG: hypothetical protein IPP15_19215 [Saprospiraceae bacterium]|uniref:Uncharacterized protein n=1 Tax=Candidatus Opimibacter skivensis TaxID=2982028 RepID=A0A9D7SWN5_9BACT|nr:hypothetical protein [Candidatus Opimibacter skivensis]
MKAVQNNPYRTVGLLVGATAREQERQVKRLKQFIEAEQDPADDFSFPKLGGGERKMEQVNEAVSKLNLNSDKMNAALFWFWNGNPITDEAAFDALKEGDIETAYEIWDKLIRESGKGTWKPVTERNCSAFHNCSILNLIWAKGYLHTAVVAKLIFLESDLINKFISSVVDETHKTTKKDLELLFLNQIHSEIETDKMFSSENFIEIVNQQGFVAKQDLMRGFIQKQIEQIEKKIEKTKNSRKTSKANAAIAGQELFTTTANELTQLKSIIGIIATNDTEYSPIADKVANEILQCSIEYFNDSQEKGNNSDYTKTTIGLVKQAETIAIGVVSKQRIKENLRDILIQSDIQALIQLIEGKNNSRRSSIKRRIDSKKDILGGDSISKAENIIEMSKPYLINIKAILKGTDETYIALSTNIAAKAQGIIIEAVNNAQILDTAILVLHDAWKVTQQISSLDTSIEFQNQFIKNKASLKKLCIQVGEDTTDNSYAKIPQLNFIIQDSEITNTDKHSKTLKTNPLYHKHTRYIGLKLNVLSFETQEVEFFSRYVNPTGNYSHNSETSPIGFTKSSTRTITPNTKSIDLGGWGNNDSSSYAVGTHSIEVWVNGSMIHKKLFTIELSPSQILEKQIKEAEEELNKINNTTYLLSEISSAKAQMTQIQIFQLFRSGFNKQKQIENQQTTIDMLLKQSEVKKE